MDRQPRRHVIRPARIDLANGKQMNCQITDISSSGARIRIMNAELLPSSFTLVDLFTNESWHADLVWSGHRTAGVTLDGSGPSIVFDPRGVSDVVGADLSPPF